MNESFRLTEILRKTIPTLKEPILFKNMLQDNNEYNWKLLEWDLCDLIDTFGDKKLPFRIGDHNKRSGVENSVEANKQCIFLTFEQFVHKAFKHEKNNDKWFYCDYKHMQEWLIDKPEIMNSFNWLRFGVEENRGKNGLYSTIWIGSKGAHTDCHQDSYGYNLVAQIYGRKLWLLYPPNNAMEPSRVPYEESTIYSKFNIYCLSDEEKHYLLERIPCKPKLIVLEPGDVLLVPNGWWHYVESLDAINISINIWRTLEIDTRARLEEALVKLLVAKVSNIDLDKNKLDKYYHTKIVEMCVIQCKQTGHRKGDESSILHEKMECNVSDEWTAKDLNNIFPNFVRLLEDTEQYELEKFFQERHERYQNVKEREDQGEKSFESILNQNAKRIAIDEWTAEDIEDICPRVKLLKGAKQHKSEEFLRKGDTNVRKQTETKKENQIESFLENVINAMCHPDVINKVAEILLEKFT